MIYILIPHNLELPMRVFHNFGLVEQVMRQGPDKCTVFGYTDGFDECSHVWTWHLGPNKSIIREPASQLLLESLHPTQ
jgi:hypothetical protein